MFKKVLWLIPVLAVIGLIDSVYLTYEKYYPNPEFCAVNAWVDCGKVLKSQWSEVMGVPLSVIGAIHYTIVLWLSLLYLASKKIKYAYGLVVFGMIGIVASSYFVYLQLVVLQAICTYCMVSAATSLLIFLVIYSKMFNEFKYLFWRSFGLIYQHLIKKILFLTEPTKIHELMTGIGEVVGDIPPLKFLTKFFFSYQNSKLSQNVAGIQFSNPIGLAAGFDYEAKLSQILASVGFGYQSVGTISNSAYGGNPAPMLGRLPKSKSLMVNKGFKNPGSDFIASKLAKYNFPIPLGISVGRTNGKDLTQEQAVQDIVNAFKKFEKAHITNSYYELNISCPNLYGNVSFYPKDKLEDLLKAVKQLKLSKPVFVKMPIEKSDKEFLDIMEIISRYPLAGIIVGNLQKDRKDPSLDPAEVAKFPVGNFSGKPTEARSNHLIELAYKKYGKKLVIIGCGGVFSVDDAYTKIKKGATLIQMITGMIFQGPQIISQINYELAQKLENDGYSHISEAVGAYHKL